MEYYYNRNAFRTATNAPGVAPLVLAYCSCILLELSIKQHLGMVSAGSNSGHNLPYLVQRLGLTYSRYRPLCSALQMQLGDALRNLHSQGKDGAPRAIPSDSYPYIRYLRHNSDWAAPSSSDADIMALNGLLNRIISLIRNQLRVAV